MLMFFSTQQEMEMEIINCAEMGEVLERGRMYERYREKREAKLREEWFLKMGEKEAEMRAMWDRFDRARTLSSCQETSRLSDVRSDSRTRQRITKSIRDEKKTKPTAASRNNSMKRSDLDQSAFSMPLTTKENRAPISKDNLNIAGSMSSPRGLSRSRTITDEKKKGVPVKSHHRRNTLAGPAEFRGLELDKNFYPDNSSSRKSRVSKPFLKKGSGIGPGAGAAIAKRRNSISSEQRDTDSIYESRHSISSQESLVELLILSSTSSGSESAGSCSNEEANNIVRERKKWGNPEKPLIFSGETQKDSTRGLKKLLLNIVGKTKVRESSVHD